MSNYIGILLMVASLLVGYFLAWPQWSSVAALREESVYLDDVAVELDELAAVYTELKNIIDTIPMEDRERIAQAIPAGPPQRNLMVQIEHLASQGGVKLQDIKFSELAADTTVGSKTKSANPIPGNTVSLPKDMGFIKELKVQLTIEGSYASLKKFLTSLERNLPIMDVKEIRFSAPSQNDSFSVNLAITTYYQ